MRPTGRGGPLTLVEEDKGVAWTVVVKCCVALRDGCRMHRKVLCVCVCIVEALKE